MYVVCTLYSVGNLKAYAVRCTRYVALVASVQLIHFIILLPKKAMIPEPPYHSLS